MDFAHRSCALVAQESRAPFEVILRKRRSKAADYVNQGFSSAVVNHFYHRQNGSRVLAVVEMINDCARKTLIDVVSSFGPTLSEDDFKRCSAFLRDKCAGAMREIHVLTLATRERHALTG